jgi:hypothetical protein
MVKKVSVLFYLMTAFILVKGEVLTDSSGRFSVGYQTLIIKDAGRPYSVRPFLPRVLPVHIWYPARESKKEKLKFITYVDAEQNGTWGNNNSQSMLRSWVKQFTDSSNVDRITMSMINMGTAAVLKATPISGKHPVVVLGNGLTTPGCFYTSMAEYLSSSGYVVVGYPASPESDSHNYGFNERGILNQIDDLEWVVDEVSQLPFVDIEKVALASWSVGDASQIILQMKRRIAKVMISLDGASQYKYGEDLIVKSLYYDSANFTVPILSLKASLHGKFVVPRSTFFYDSVAINKMQFVFANFSHSDFLSFAQYVKYFETADQKRKDTHNSMCEIVRMYLDGKLLDKAASIKHLGSLPNVVNGD